MIEQKNAMLKQCYHLQEVDNLMSIVQEYESIRKEIGEEKYQAIENYLEIHQELFLSDIYYKEAEWLKFEEWYNKS